MAKSCTSELGSGYGDEAENKKIINNGDEAEKNETLWLSEDQRASTPVGCFLLWPWQTSWPVFLVQDEKPGSSSGNPSKYRSTDAFIFTDIYLVMALLIPEPV